MPDGDLCVIEHTTCHSSRFLSSNINLLTHMREIITDSRQAGFCHCSGVPLFFFPCYVTPVVDMIALAGVCSGGALRSEHFDPHARLSEQEADG